MLSAIADKQNHDTYIGGGYEFYAFRSLKQPSVYKLEMYEYKYQVVKCI